MADYRSMQPNRGTSYSDLSEATKNLTLSVEMPGEVRSTLNSYVPLDADDETVKLLRETFRYLPSGGRDINSMVSVMTLSLPMHAQFRRFSLALEQTTDTINQYRVKTYRGFATAHRAELPASGTISMTAHGGSPLASPILLQVHCAIANILHATGEGAKIARVLGDSDATGGLASNGIANISQLLSVTKLASMPHLRRFDDMGSTDD
ncbi:uncharacterized protein NFIA_087220 [Aspergillus fischeri NRRL 181]|uniref:HNH nuclease domain-containing protein n=1 Tax=Neosartorya fischeri (strain ATCC 1020 / DSM 3700 / CBS 544.65 / FGSC A1164 / JCM 1740 / NRRL 181 / WB 181) TaxID=331117 RepID=A1DHA9_NEOFI|nr:uncharacterized protein NFIA_087220 [Aspergillus fischeri NRRL 181]EAW18766.1 hypothetical protein NFIA_087220 [Aspergillus fischeri NRRL 181]